MEELITNLHIHTTYSDGRGSHQDIARAALSAGLDVVIVTDHNVLVQGLDGYHGSGERRLLMLVGEEIHDRTRQPQKNHLLAIGANRELCAFAPQPQRLIDQVNQAGGVSILAHPYEVALPLFNEEDIAWVDWQVNGFTGIELWNNLSEFKTVVSNRLLHAAFHAFFPQYMTTSPMPAMLNKWDELLAAGKRVTAVGGSDAHALHVSMGPIHRTLYPYEFHFRCINTHLLTETGLSGDLAADRRMILDALRQGHAFVGYDLPAPTRGFRFVAQGRDQIASMGDEINLNGGITLQIRLPAKCECYLLKDGKPVRSWRNSDAGTYIANQPGVYRVECYVHYLGRRRGWIYSNPIYIRG